METATVMVGAVTVLVIVVGVFVRAALRSDLPPARNGRRVGGDGAGDSR